MWQTKADSETKHQKPLNLSRVCLSVCLCVCLSLCLSVYLSVCLYLSLYLTFAFFPFYFPLKNAVLPMLRVDPVTMSLRMFIVIREFQVNKFIQTTMRLFNEIFFSIFFSFYECYLFPLNHLDFAIDFEIFTMWLQMY